MNVALVCIAKNEDNYIQEWIDYHLKLGFDDIYIYENDWKSNIVQNNVITISFDGKAKQLPAYDNFVKEYSQLYDWVCFLDVDEFIVLKKHNNIKEFINDYSNYNAIGINWVLFGDNGLTDIVNNEYSVIKRFTKCESKPNIHIKSIQKSWKDIKMLTPHNSQNNTISTCYTEFKGPFLQNCNTDIAQINHYFCKTYNEFLLKHARGRSDTGTMRNIADFNKHNKNEVEDLTAYKFMYD